MSIATQAARRSLAELYALWDQLADVPVTFEGLDVLDAPFEQFEAGTPREDVWHWFEAQNPRFVVGAVLQGIRPAD